MTTAVAVERQVEVGVHVCLLGPVSATVDGVQADLGGPKERALLALLAANPTSPRSPDWLIDALWGDEVPKTARKTLQTYVSHLRLAFSAASGQVIVSGPGGYALSSAVRIDVEEVEALMAAANRPGVAIDSAERAKLLADAMSRCGQEPLAGTASCRPLDALAESYVQLRWNLVEALAEARLAAGGDPTLTVDLRAWVDENPLREGLWGHLMVALYRSGRQAEALAAYQRARANLVEGLGVEPGPELRDLEAAILRQAPELHDGRIGSRTPPAVSETLTFLFTDIEQSTVRWDLEPVEMQRALALHDEVIGAAIRDGGGRIFHEGGDGFGIGFPSAEDAARSALEAQAHLRSTTWPTAEPLRVRMGLHTGVAEARGGNYFGIAVNRAARLMEVAHGGQIVCSAATAALLADTKRCDLVALGSVHLKGLERPELVHQVDPTGRVGAFPEIRSAEPMSRLPPALLDSLHGRDQEMAEVADLLGDHRLLTMTGVGGTGKTRLAAEVATRRREAYADGVIWVDLAGVDVDGVVTAIAAAAGIGLNGDPAGHLTRLAAILSTEQALVVLDNCEHLLGSAASVAERLVRSCPGLTVITTSREPLGVAGERVYLVPSLGLPIPGGPISPSEEMLRARADDAGARLGEDEEVANALRAICTRLDGVPLALEFAGAQLAAFTAPQLLVRLEEHFRSLGRPGRTAIPRQQTIDSTIDWSYQLLDDADRALLRRLAVFQDGFTLDAAKAIAADLFDGSPEDAVERLRWKSLVVVHPAPVDDHPRFKLLEPVRQFAHARLRTRDELDDALDRHAGYVLGIAARPLVGQRFTNDESTAALQRDLPNLRLAADTLADRRDPTDLLRLYDGSRICIAFAADLSRFTELVRGRLRSTAGQVDPLVEGHACNTLAFADSMAGNVESVMWLGRAMELASLTGDDTLRAETEFHLGAFCGVLDDPAAAATHFEVAIPLHEALGNEDSLAVNLAWYGLNITHLGRIEEAMGLERRAVACAHAASVRMSLVLGPVAAVAVRAGEPVEAVLALEELVELGDTEPIGSAAAVELGRLDLATTLHARLLRAHRQSHLLDPPLAMVTSMLCDRLAEPYLAALWAAAAVAQERSVSGGGAAAGWLTSWIRTLPRANPSDTEVARARSTLGDRFDELVVRYGREPWALVDHTLLVLATCAPSASPMRASADGSARPAETTMSRPGDHS